VRVRPVRVATMTVTLAVTLATAFSVTTAVGARTNAQQPAVASAANTVTVDLARSLGPFRFGPGRQLSATPNTWRFGTDTYANLDRLRLERVRVWLEFTQTYDVATRTPDYAKWYEYLDTYSSRASTLVLNWRSNYDPLVTGGTFTEAELFAAQRDMLAHYKQRYPKIEFVESEAEPPVIASYYPKYRLLYRVVNAVNALGLPGPALKIGGPTIDIFSELRIGQFLDLYAADPDPAKRLDFIAYHQYLINTGSGDWTATKDNPALVATERARLDALLAARGLGTRPALVSETGIFPGTRQSDLGLEADWHIQAAALASIHYHYLGQRDVVPMDWTIDHENDRKDLFVDRASGVPRPYYNAMRMQSMLPPTRYQATSDALSSRGLGVYGLAGASATRIAAMTWNYQWTNQTAYDSRVVFTNFPAAFRGSNVLVERYRIDKDVHSGDLVPVDRYVIGPRTTGSYYSPYFPLDPNELRLMVLTPTTLPIGQLPPA
jgi:hypothetical protein